MPKILPNSLKSLSFFPKLSQKSLAAIALIVGSLGSNIYPAAADPTPGEQRFYPVTIRPAPGERGFWCDNSTGIPMTLYQNAAGNVETWIVWRSPVFNNLGYTPQSRCQDVSQNFETQRQTGKLGFLTSSTLNGMTVICAAQAEGVCDGILFTVNDPSQVVPLLGQLLALREGVTATPPLEL